MLFIAVGISYKAYVYNPVANSIIFHFTGSRQGVLPAVCVYHSPYLTSFLPLLHGVAVTDEPPQLTSNLCFLFCDTFQLQSSLTQSCHLFLGSSHLPSTLNFHLHCMSSNMVFIPFQQVSVPPVSLPTFSLIFLLPFLPSYVLIPNPLLTCYPTHPLQHSHFCYIHPFLLCPFHTYCFCSTQHGWSNNCCMKVSLQS